MRTPSSTLATGLVAATAALAGAAAVAPAGASTAPSPTTSYVVATHAGSTARLQLVDRRTGATTRTLATAPMVVAYGTRTNPFRDATIGPDGTVWAVRAGAGTYSSSLLRIKGGQVATFMPYVVAARVSPDGRRLAVSVVSPDANRDGRGTTSLRVGSTSGGSYRTLAQETFPVDGRGEPRIDVVAPVVSTWLGTSRLVVTRGCCDSSDVTVVRADVPSSISAWRGLAGAATTVPVAKIAQESVLVPKQVERGRGTSNDPAYTIGYDIFRVSAAKPLGVKVGYVPGLYGRTDALKTFVARSGATPLTPWVSTLPYRPVKGVVRDDTFLGR